MPPRAPLPFLLPVPRYDTLDHRGARSITYRVDGLLQLEEDRLALEWVETERIQQVSLTGVRTNRESLPREVLEVPLTWIAEARLVGGWWMPRLELRAHRLDAFDGLLSGCAGVLRLRIPRRYRRQAAAMVAAINLARIAFALGATGAMPRLEEQGGWQPPVEPDGDVGDERR